jgi:hypothetical protein
LNPPNYFKESLQICRNISIFEVDYDKRTATQTLCVDREHAETAKKADTQQVERAEDNRRRTMFLQ